MAWALLAFVALVLTLATLVTGGRWTIAVGAVTLLAAGCAFWATRYNGRTYPVLRTLWEQSFMCARCGEVFSA